MREAEGCFCDRISENSCGFVVRLSTVRKMILPIMIAASLLFEDTKSTFGIPQVCRKKIFYHPLR